jgi:hypothetical protein
MPAGLRSALTPQGEGEGGKPVASKPVAVKTEETVVKTPKKTVTKKAKVKTGSGASGFGMDEKSFESRRKTPSTSELKSVAKTRAGTPAKSDNLGTLTGVLGAAALGGAGLSQLRKKLMRPDVGGSSERSRASSSGKSPRIMGIDLAQEDEMMRFADEGNPNYKKGGKTKSKPVKKYAGGGMVGKASSRADGIAKRGKTKGRIC